MRYLLSSKVKSFAAADFSFFFQMTNTSKYWQPVQVSFKLNNKRRSLKFFFRSGWNDISVSHENKVAASFIILHEYNTILYEYNTDYM